MAADQEQFYQILNTLLSTDNDIRTQAEVRKCVLFNISYKFVYKSAGAMSYFA